VVSNSFVEVTSISFVDWVKQNVTDYKSSFNILRFNIEGAELPLIQDIVNKNFRQYIHVFLGAVPGADILKVSEIQSQYDYYIKLLKDNTIDILPYCQALKNNVTIKNIIQTKSNLYENANK
jgi:hypothetical protein